MDAIINWFKNSQDYYEGVAIYATLPIKKTRTIKQLNRGKTNRNMSLLVAELRKYKNAPLTPVKTKKIKIEQPVIPTQTQINIEAQRKQLVTESTNIEFGGIMIGDLPAELRVRYSRARSIFYEMIELKFALNDLPPEAEESALKIMLHIEDLDTERDLIWKELNHYKTYKTLLPTKVSDFSDLTERQLDLKRRNLKSNITKLNQRVENWYVELEDVKDKFLANRIENKINKAEKTIHQHKLNIVKIEELL